MLQNNYNENSLNNKLFIYFFSDFLHIPKQNLISADEWDNQLASVFDVDEIIDSHLVGGKVVERLKIRAWIRKRKNSP